MPVCPGGSHPKPDVPTFVLLTPEIASKWLPPGVNWMHDFLRFIGPLFIDVPALCALEPPPFPSIDVFDVINVVTGGKTGAYTTSAEKFYDVMRMLAWYTLCECTAGATPALPALPAPPANLPVIDPPIVVGPDSGSASPCYSQMTTTAIESGEFEYAQWQFLDSQPTLTSVRLTIHQPPNAAGTISPAAFKIFLTGDDALPLYQTVIVPPAFDLSITVPVIADMHEFRVVATAGYTQTVPTTILIEGFCGAGRPPAGGADECCGPDPLVSARLTQILDMVTLLQRQGEPFAYVPGPAVHSGLVGIGELDVDGLIGVLVEVTTLPPGLGHLAGMPDMLFDVGWLTIGTADGWERRIRIDSAQQLVIPAHMGLVTRVGYSLSPNVVIRISELVREP